MPALSLRKVPDPPTHWKCCRCSKLSAAGSRACANSHACGARPCEGCVWVSGGQELSPLPLPATWMCGGCFKTHPVLGLFTDEKPPCRCRNPVLNAVYDQFGKRMKELESEPKPNLAVVGGRFRAAEMLWAARAYWSEGVKAYMEKFPDEPKKQEEPKKEDEPKEEDEVKNEFKPKEKLKTE